MRNLASLFILASLFSLGYAVMGPAQPTLESHIVFDDQTAQAPMGRKCVTRTGSCAISPSPINTRCYCGNERGIVVR